MLSQDTATGHQLAKRNYHDISAFAGNHRGELKRRPRDAERADVDDIGVNGTGTSLQLIRLSYVDDTLYYKSTGFSILLWPFLSVVVLLALTFATVAVIRMACYRRSPGHETAQNGAEQRVHAIGNNVAQGTEV